MIPYTKYKADLTFYDKSL